MSYNSLGLSLIPTSLTMGWKVYLVGLGVLEQVHFANKVCCLSMCVCIKTLDFVSLMYRVDRVLGFFSKSTELGPAPTLSHPGKGVPSPFGSGWGGDTLDCGRGAGGGGPNRMRGQTLWCSRYMCTLWFTATMRYIFPTTYFSQRNIKTYFLHWN